jgi:hypothetical protein
VHCQFRALRHWLERPAASTIDEICHADANVALIPPGCFLACGKILPPDADQRVLWQRR